MNWVLEKGQKPSTNHWTREVDEKHFSLLTDFVKIYQLLFPYLARILNHVHLNSMRSEFKVIYDLKTFLIIVENGDS